jgi:hypothetical protein
MGKKSMTSSIAVAKMREYKRDLSSICEGLPVREFKPLRVEPHMRQREMDEYRAIPSQYNTLDKSE